MNYFADLDVRLPGLPAGYEWQTDTYLKDTYQIWWAARIVRVTPRRFWFAHRHTVRSAEWRSEGGIPTDRILRWARKNAAEIERMEMMK